MSKVALITGITGQDGSYLAEFLLEKGYEVHGIVRRASISNTARIDHLIEKNVIKLHDGDLSDSSGLIRLVGEIRPDEIYNLAAQSHVQVSFDAPEYSGDVDALGVLRVLEAVRVCGLTKTCKVYQASTSELYGKVEEVPQKETTPFHPYSPYAVAKQYGFWMVKEYRDAYGMFAVNGILFNHESERRGENFVTRKITLAAGRIAEGLQDHLELGNMDSLRDWGYAKDYVECMWLIMQQEKPEDFVIATGVQHTVRDFTEKAFAANGMTIRWEGTHKELDLTRQDAVEKFFAAEKPEYVFLAAAKVGGIVANQNALADFMYDNMILEMNVIHSAWKNGCRKLEFLGSSCIYPRMAPQPMKESCLLTSELEKTNEAYALAKISGLKYCEFLNRQYGTDYISVMPTNLYGPNDNYHPTHSHVLPALIRRFHEAKESGAASVTCWGDGSPLREFLYVDDLANLCVFLMNNYSGNETVNAGTGKELTIKELTELVAKVVGYNGEIKWDPDKPNGTPRKLLDVSKATNLGWTYKTELEEGIRLAYEDFLNNPMRAER